MISLIMDNVLIIHRHGQDGAPQETPCDIIVVATSNSLSKGVHDMSAALKRRINFETIGPIRDIHDEINVAVREARELINQSGVDVKPSSELIEVVVIIFHEFRNGQPLD